MTKKIKKKNSENEKRKGIITVKKTKERKGDFIWKQTRRIRDDVITYTEMKTPCRTDSPSLGDYLLFIICDWGKKKKKR